MQQFGAQQPLSGGWHQPVTGGTPVPPPPQPAAVHPAQPQLAQAPPAPAGGPPPVDTTGHVRLPAGAPVQMPAQSAGPAQPDAARAAVAVLLIGPAGAGKTTVARHWAERRPVPTAHRVVGALSRPSAWTGRPLLPLQSRFAAVRRRLAAYLDWYLPFGLISLVPIQCPDGLGERFALRVVIDVPANDVSVSMP